MTSKLQGHYGSQQGVPGIAFIKNRKHFQGFFQEPFPDKSGGFKNTTLSKSSPQGLVDPSLGSVSPALFSSRAGVSDPHRGLTDSDPSSTGSVCCWVPGTRRSCPHRAHQSPLQVSG